MALSPCPTTKRAASSHSPQDEALEVVGLGHAQQYRVVTRLRASLDDGHDSPGISCRLFEHRREQRLADVVRAAAGDQVTASYNFV